MADKRPVIHEEGCAGHFIGTSHFFAGDVPPPHRNESGLAPSASCFAPRIPLTTFYSLTSPWSSSCELLEFFSIEEPIAIGVDPIEHLLGHSRWQLVAA